MQIALGRSSFSEDGSLFAYQLSSGGSDWVTINLMRVDAASGKTTKLDDVLQHVKFSGITWTHDHKVPCASAGWALQTSSYGQAAHLQRNLYRRGAEAIRFRIALLSACTCMVGQRHTVCA